VYDFNVKEVGLLKPYYSNASTDQGVFQILIKWRPSRIAKFDFAVGRNR